MNYWLFLDDERFPPDKPIMDYLPQYPIVARTFGDFVRCIEENGCPMFITFDHDLGTDKTGMSCARWFVNWVLDDTTRLRDDFTFDVHSQNPVGAENINSLMRSFMACVR